jgi:hypothetical protein
LMLLPLSVLAKIFCTGEFPFNWMDLLFSSVLAKELELKLFSAGACTWPELVPRLWCLLERLVLQMMTPPAGISVPTKGSPLFSM